MIAAMDNAGGIGKNNRMPWSLKEDMTFFRKSTTGMGNNAIVMGRKTHESIGMFLPRRENIILTRNNTYQTPILKTANVYVMPIIKHDVQSVIDHCKSKKICTLWVIGGSEIYKLFMDVVDELYLTKIDKIYKCDTFFPEISEDKFSLRNIDFYSVNDMFDDTRNTIPMEIQHYVKNK
jgi:dihydrofolate reductase